MTDVLFYPDVETPLPDSKLMYHAWGWVQRCHDESFHPDIYNLPKHDGLKHYVLHLAKYSRCFYPETIGDLKEEQILRTFTDAFIIGTAICNLFNLRVSEMITEARALPDKVQFLNVVHDFAKTTEAFDHIEVFDYAGTIRSSCIGLFRALMDIREGWFDTALQQGFDRLMQVERKHFMYDHLKESQYVRWGQVIMYSDEGLPLKYTWGEGNEPK